MKKSTTAIAVLAVASLFAGTLFLANAGRARAQEDTTPAITSFGFSSLAASGTINEGAKTIGVIVPYGTNVTYLYTNFDFNGAEVWASGSRQYSGDSHNDFSEPVVYTVYSCPQEVARANTGMRIAIAEVNENSNLNDNTNDNTNDDDVSCTSVSYTVTVTVAPAPTITAFSFATPSATGVIDQDAKTISVTVPYGTDVTALTPTVTVTDGATVFPASGVANDFTNPAVYTVDPCLVDYTRLNIATVRKCGTPYTVTVTVAAPPDVGGGGSSGGSGWEDPMCRKPVSPPDGGFSIAGANGNNVNDRNVTLKINGGAAVAMSISNDLDFTGATIEPYAATKAWELTAGEGQKFVYIRFYNDCRIATDIYTAEFNYSAASPAGQVLGVQTYADGTLLRGPDHRIYVLTNGHLVYIHDLAELAAHYFGLPILDVSAAVIAQYL
jgi:hypothetical protein